MSFDPGRDVVTRLDRIERHLAALVDLLRELMGKEPPGPGWLSTIPAEEYRRRARASRARAGQASGPDDNLPPAGGVPVEDFFARRER